MKKILMFVLIILLVGTVSAVEWDNVKSYDKETKTITVKNAFGLPLIGTKIAEIQFNTPLIHKIIRGEDRKIAELIIKNYGEYTNVFKAIESYDLKRGNKKIDREFTYKYKKSVGFKEVSDYKNSCSETGLLNGTTIKKCENVLIGTHQEEVFEWTVLDTSKPLPKGEITIGIFTDVLPNDNVEWIPTFFGVKIKEWAIWTESLNLDLNAYFTLNDTDTPGNPIDSLGNFTTIAENITAYGTAGIIGTALNFTGTASNNGSIVYNLTGVGITDYPLSFNVWIRSNQAQQTVGAILGLYRLGSAGKITMNHYLNTIRVTRDNGIGTTDFPGIDTGVNGVNNSWIMITAVMPNSSYLGIYVNAVSKANSTDTVSFPGGTLQLVIGADSADATAPTLVWPWTGIIDEISVYSRELLVSEIQQKYNEGAGITWTETFLTPPIITLIAPDDTSNFTASNVTFNVTVTDNVEVSEVTLFIDGAVNNTNTSLINGTYIYNLDFIDGNYNWSIGAIDDMGTPANSSTRTFTIDTTAPIITSNSSVTFDLQEINTNLTIYFNITEANPDTCLYDYNGTNVSISCSDTSININTTTSTNRNIAFYANDTLGYETTFDVIWNYTIFENSQTFNDETFEGVINTFTANVTIEESNLITIANFIYNETSTIGSFSQSGNDSILTIDFLAPNVDTDINLTFFWSLTLLDAQIINLTSHNQTVNIISVDNCSVNTVVLYNYTVVDEGNQSLLSNTTTELSINLLDTARQSSILNFSIKYLKTNPFAICINENLSSSAYAIDSIVKYEATGYSIEYYNIVNAIITNSTIPEEITLYDLASADATEFKITFKAEDFTFVENALIYIDRQYIAENNTFKTVELPKTDSNGQTVGHFVRNDVVYNIRVIKDGIVLGNFKNIIAFCEDYTIGACQMVLEATPEDLIIFDYDEQLGIIFQTLPTYNENTSAISFDFSTDDGTIKTVSMDVTRDDIFGNRSICNNTLTSSSGTLICSFDPNIDDSVLRVGVTVDGQQVVLSSVILEASDYGNLGYVLWFFLTFLFILLFGHTKTEVLIGVSISFIGAISLGITRGNIVGLGSAGIWVLVIIILGIVKLNKERPQ